MRKTEDHVAWF